MIRLGLIKNKIVLHRPMCIIKMYRRQIFFSVYQKFNLAVWILEKYHSSQQPLFTPLRFLLRKEKQIRLPLSISLAFFSKMVNDRFGQKTSSTPGSQAEK